MFAVPWVAYVAAREALRSVVVGVLLAHVWHLAVAALRYVTARRTMSEFGHGQK